MDRSFLKPFAVAEATVMAVSSNPPATDNHMVIIKHSRLPRRYGSMGFVERHNHRTVISLRHRGLSLFGPRADFYRDADRLDQFLNRDPIDALDRHLALQQVVTRSDHHAVVLRVHTHDVERVGR